MKKNPNIKGMRARRTLGVTILIITITPMTEKIWFIMFFIFKGRIISISSISFENLFTILPSGVVSKNDIGLFKMLFNSPLCKLVDAFIVANVTITIAENMNTD